MADHDPVTFVTGLSAKLAARTRHVCVFMGAGASKACGLPDVATLQDSVLGELDETKRAAFNAACSPETWAVFKSGSRGQYIAQVLNQKPNGRVV